MKTTGKSSFSSVVSQDFFAQSKRFIKVAYKYRGRVDGMDRPHIMDGIIVYKVHHTPAATFCPTYS